MNPTIKYSIFTCIIAFFGFHERDISFKTCEDQTCRPSENILFVGNSLTYTNNLPELVRDLARKDGKRIKTKMLAFPNYALEDHWNTGQLQKLISSKKFDIIVVQQGPSSQPDGRETLLTYGAKIRELCDTYDVKLAFFMVWPAKQNYHMFDGVIKNYSEAASACNAILCPVGKVWKDFMDTTGDYSYYGTDQFHPSLAGSNMAAEVIYHSLFGR